MKRLLFFLSIFYIHTCASIAQTVEWSSSFNKASASYHDCKFIEHDAAGNIYTARMLYIPSVGYHIAKFAHSGALIWQSLYTGVEWDRMTTDSTGNTYLIGRFYMNATVGGININDTAHHAVKFYAKYDSNGTCLWAKKFGERTFLGDISPSRSGIFYMVGFAQDTLYLSGDTVPSNKGFICKLDSAGVVLSAKPIGGLLDYRYLKIDALGNFYVSGGILGTSYLGNSDSLLYISGNSWINVFLAKLDSNLNPLWAHVGKTCDGQANGFELDAVGNAYMAGTLVFYMMFGTSGVSTRGGNMFLVKFDPSGNYQWMKYSSGLSSGTTHADCYALEVDDAGNSFVTGGTSNDTVQFDSFTLNGHEKPYLIKYDTYGNLLWAMESNILPSGTVGEGTDLCLDHLGNLYIGGSHGTYKEKSFLTKISESSITTEIQQTENDSDLIIYPNPTGGNFFVNYSSAEITTLELTVLNALGQKVYSEKIPRFQGEFKKEISTSNFSKGIYTVQIRNGKNLKFKKVVVI